MLNNTEPMAFFFFFFFPFPPSNWLTRNIVNTAREQMQEWFCLQLRCAGVSAETEGDKGTGRPISRAVLLPFFFFFLSLLPAQATVIQFSFRDVGLLRRSRALGSGRPEQGERPRAGPDNLAGDRERERKEGDGGGVGVSGFYFIFFFPGWLWI